MPSPNPMTRHEHVGAAVLTTLNASMSVGDTSFNIVANTGWPTGAVGTFYVVIDAGTADEEKVLCSAQSAGTVTVAGSGRGADGTTAKAHTSGRPVRPCWTAQESDEANAHCAAASAVHGVAGNVVGHTDVQTLTNKTISGANNTLSAIPQASVTSLVADLAALTAADAAKQNSDATLTALAGLNATTGIVTETAADTFTKRNLAAANSMVVITNPAGVAGDFTVGVAPANFTGMVIAGTTGLQAAIDAKTPLGPVVNKVADEDVTSSAALQNDDALFLALPVGTYKIETHLKVVSSNSPGGGDIQVAYANTGTMSVSGARMCLGPTLTEDAPDAARMRSTATMSLGAISYGLALIAAGINEVFLITVSVTGTLTLRWAQDNSDVDTTTVQIGSWMLATRVA